MSSVESRSLVPSSNRSVQLDTEISFTVRTDSDAVHWFVKAARKLLGSDPGLSLHVLADISPSSGYRYAKGERPLPGDIVRLLLRSDQGRQWLNAVMDGCNAKWWNEMQRDERVGSAALKEFARGP